VSIGLLLALLMLVLAILFAVLGQMDLKTAGLIAGTDLAILVGGYTLPVRTP
jgi:hypothetical protein